MVDEYTAAILMSHDYKTDKRNLPLVLPTAAPYIGMLGPRVRAERMISELAEEGILFSENDQERIFAPVGLDIGAISPEEIALSIAAEITGGFFQAQRRAFAKPPLHHSCPIGTLSGY